VVTRYRSDRCQVSIARRWHLALCQHLLLITFQPRTYNYGIHRVGNHWAPCCQLDVWLVMYFWGIMDQAPYIKQSCVQWFTSLWTICQHKASCHLASDTWHQLLLFQDTRLWTRCDKFLYISHDYNEVRCVYHLLPCAMYTPNSEQSTWYQNVCHPTFLYSL
jgi:hypothetical protein